VSSAGTAQRPTDAIAAAALHAELSPEATRRRELVWQDPLASFERAASLSGLDYMRAIMAGEIPPPPIAVLMRMAATEVSEGVVGFTGSPGEEHYNLIGVVQGGYASTLFDAVLGCAVQTTLPAGVAYTTLTLEVKMLRPLTRETGEVLARAEVVHRGRRQATAEARLTAPATGKLLATATSTCMILAG
jgi:uncharacterized protein (TIGR00369 family)